MLDRGHSLSCAPSHHSSASPIEISICDRSVLLAMATCKDRSFAHFGPSGIRKEEQEPATRWQRSCLNDGRLENLGEYLGFIANRTLHVLHPNESQWSPCPLCRQAVKLFWREARLLDLTDRAVQHACMDRGIVSLSVIFCYQASCLYGPIVSFQPPRLQARSPPNFP